MRGLGVTTVDRHWESLPFISQLSEVCIDTLITPEITIEIKYLSIFTLIGYVYPSVDPYPKDKLWIHQWIWIWQNQRSVSISTDGYGYGYGYK